MKNDNPEEKKSFEKPNIILVEGYDDERVLNSFLNKLELTNYQLFELKSREKLEKYIRYSLKETPGFDVVRSICIIRDADDDYVGAFKSISNALEHNGLPSPAQAWKIIDKNNLKVGIVILPSIGENGMLEDLCLKSIVDKPEIACINGYLGCLDRLEVPKSKNPSKAKVQIYLASRPKPYLGVGIAASKGYWDWDHKAFSQLKQFLTKMFENRLQP